MRGRAGHRGRKLLQLQIAIGPADELVDDEAEVGRVDLGHIAGDAIAIVDPHRLAKQQVLTRRRPEPDCFIRPARRLSGRELNVKRSVGRPQPAEDAVFERIRLGRCEGGDARRGDGLHQLRFETGEVDPGDDRGPRRTAMQCEDAECNPDHARGAVHGNPLPAHQALRPGVQNSSLGTRPPKDGGKSNRARFSIQSPAAQKCNNFLGVGRHWLASALFCPCLARRPDENRCQRHNRHRDNSKSKGILHRGKLVISRWKKRMSTPSSHRSRSSTTTLTLVRFSRSTFFLGFYEQGKG